VVGTRIFTSVYCLDRLCFLPYISLQVEKITELQSQLEKLSTHSPDADVSYNTSFPKCMYTFKSTLYHPDFSTYCLNILLQSLNQNLEQKMMDHCNKIQAIKNEINLVEDTVFSDFCQRIGIATIREYEGIGLR
jgi:hypothetical protein